MFLQNVYKYTLGYAKLQAEGYFVERLINLLLNREIEVWGIERKYEAIIEFKIRLSDLDKIDELANITRSKITILQKIGMPHVASTYSKRKIFVFVFALVVISIYVLSLRIWKIEIYGVKNISVEEIEEELKLEDVRIGMLKKDFDFDKIKNNIYMRRKDIVWLGFDIKGVRANVEILERTEPKQEDLKGKPCNIIANRDGVVEKISVREGTRMVNQGDIVYSGDVLVKGVMGSQYSPERYVHSDAEIELKTWYTGKAVIPYEKTLVSKTGNIEKRYKISIGKCTINLLNNSTKFEKYDTISSVDRLVLFGKVETPIMLETTTFEECTIDEVNYTFEQAEEVAKEEALKLALTNIPENARQVDTKYKIFHTDNDVAVRVTIECLENVGIKQKLSP